MDTPIKPNLNLEKGTRAKQPLKIASAMRGGANPETDSVSVNDLKGEKTHNDEPTIHDDSSIGGKMQLKQTKPRAVSVLKLSKDREIIREYYDVEPGHVYALLDSATRKLRMLEYIFLFSKQPGPDNPEAVKFISTIHESGMSDGLSTFFFKRGASDPPPDRLEHNFAAFKLLSQTNSLITSIIIDWIRQYVYKEQKVVSMWVEGHLNALMERCNFTTVTNTDEVKVYDTTDPKLVSKVACEVTGVAIDGEKGKVSKSEFPLISETPSGPLTSEQAKKVEVELVKVAIADAQAELSKEPVELPIHENRDPVKVAEKLAPTKSVITDAWVTATSEIVPDSLSEFGPEITEESEDVENKFNKLVEAVDVMESDSEAKKKKVPTATLR